MITAGSSKPEGECEPYPFDTETEQRLALELRLG